MISPSNTHPLKVCMLESHTIFLPPAEGGRSHPTLPFPLMDPDHDDIKPRKGEAARTHAPLLPTITRNGCIAICLLRRLESTAGGKYMEAGGRF